MDKSGPGKVEGKKPRREDPKPPSAEPEAKDQVNFRDPESRIMPLGGKGAFGQAYNAQAGVEIDSRLIVTQPVSNAPNDKIGAGRPRGGDQPGRGKRGYGYSWTVGF